MLVATNKELYISLPKKQKMMLSQSIVNAVRSQIPSGRFLQKDVQNDLWYDVGDKRAQEKTSQALREGAPEIRTKLCHTTNQEMATSTIPSSDGLIMINHTTTCDEESTHDDYDKSKHSVPESDDKLSKTNTSISVDSTDSIDPKSIQPLPLDHATSKEQMPPPPPTVPSSSPSFNIPHTKLKHPPPTDTNTNQRKHQRSGNTNKSDHPRPPVHQQQVHPIPVNRLDYYQSNGYKNSNEDGTTEQSSAPPPPMPIPYSFHEAHQSCSFGSMGLMSDIEQARLMQNLLSSSSTTTTTTAADQASHRDTYNTTTSTSKSQHPYPPSQGEHRHNDYPQTNGPMYYNNHNDNYHHHYHHHHHPANPQYPQHYSSQSDRYHYTQQDQHRSSYQNNTYMDDYTGTNQEHYTSGNGSRSQQHQSHSSPPLPSQHQSHSSPPPPMEDISMPQPVDGGLEPPGFSMGSMMSIGTTKLEDAGLSLGSAMSYTPQQPSSSASRRGSSNTKYFSNNIISFATQPPDGGLQDIGTSFGSLSLADGDRERIIAEAERDMATMPNLKKSDSDTYGNDECYIPTTFLNQQKSRGSLLDSNNAEDDDDDTPAEVSAQRSAHQWNMLQATLAAQDESIRNAVHVPPMYVTNMSQSNTAARNKQQQQAFDVPRFDREMSAISVTEDDYESPSPILHASATTTTKSSSRYSDSYSYPSDDYNPHNTNSCHRPLDPINHDGSNLDEYESSILQDLLLPPVLKSSGTNNRY
jgi:hypothetical protein